MMTLRVNGGRNAVRSEFFMLLAAAGEDLHQFLRRNDFELSVRTVAGLLVGAPSAELGHVAKPAPLHVFVRHLYNQLGTQRLPGEILALTPSALAAGHPVLSVDAIEFMLLRETPWVVGRCVFTEGGEVFH